MGFKCGADFLNQQDPYTWLSAVILGCELFSRREREGWDCFGDGGRFRTKVRLTIRQCYNSH